MPKLLHIQTSPNLGQSVTRVLSDKFVTRWCETHPGTDVEVLDLVKAPVPHFGPEIMAAAVTAPEQMTPETLAAVGLSDKLTTQLEEADIIVIGLPMINFTIPSQFKTWFDHVAVPGRTFQQTGPGVARGLLFGKKAFVIEARGGDYSELPMNSFDFQEPLTKWLLMFLGIYDITFLRAEGGRAKPEEMDAILRAAEEQIERIAA